MFVSFLGLGQGGGNIVDEAAKRGIYSAAINFSQRDLDSLEYVENKLKAIGSEGIGKQRKEALHLMNNNWDLTTKFVQEHFSHPSIEIIFVPFSTAGGSGSGIAPVLISLLKEMMPNKVFVAMPIIPDIDESFLNQKNCLETFEDILEIDVCILPIDNQKVRKELKTTGKNMLYKKVNSSVIDIIEDVVSFTDKNSKYGVLDKKDLKSVFMTKGIATIGKTEIANLSGQFNLIDESFAQYIHNSWRDSIFADIEEGGNIKSAGIVFEGQEILMEYLNLKSIFSIFENKMPINLYEGYYTGNKGTVLTILTGLSVCKTRLDVIDQSLSQTNSLMRNFNSNETYKSNSLSEVENLSQNKKEKVKDISSIINKFKR